MTPRQLYDWASKNIPSCHFKYSTDKDYENHRAFIERRHSSARPIPGTQKLYCVTPVSRTTTKTKIFSNSVQSWISVAKYIRTGSGSGGYTWLCHCCVWLITNGGLGVFLMLTFLQSKLRFLHPHGPSLQFTYPQKPNVLEVYKKEVIAKVDLQTATGWTYSIEQSEIEPSCWWPSPFHFAL